MEGECSTSVDTVRSIHAPSSTLDMTTPSASITSSTTTVTGTQRLPPKAPLSTLPAIPSHPEPSTAAEVSRPVSPTPSNHSLSDADSESSFPSVSSSFFFSSAAHSPYSNPYSQPHSNDSGGEYESQVGEELHMIIPSLTLPEPVHPTPRPDHGGKEEIRLIIVVGSDMSREVERSLSGGYWEEEGDNLKVLRGSLSGQEPADLEPEEEKRGLRLALWVVEPSGAQDAREITRTIRRLVISSFHLLDSRLHVAHETDTLASSTFFSDVYTAVLICPTASSIDHVGDVKDLIPSIYLDSPISQQTLQDLILPTGLSRQKKEVADNFLRWRASRHDRDTTLTHVQNNVQRMRRWSKAEWEREVEEELGVSLYPISTLSSSPLPPIPLTARVPPHTVHRFATARMARRRSSREMLALRRNSPSPEATIVSPRPRSPRSTGNGGVRPRKRPLSPPPPLPSSPSPAPSSQAIPPHHSVIVDPLHLPSLVMLGVELVGAMRKRVFGSRRIQKEFELRKKETAGSSSGSSSPVKFLMLGFCVGVGVGVWLGRVVWGTV